MMIVFKEAQLMRGKSEQTVLTKFNIKTSRPSSERKCYDMTGAIDSVKQLTPKRFSYISDPDSTIVDGFLAHEALKCRSSNAAVSGTHNEVDDDGNAVMQGIRPE